MWRAAHQERTSAYVVPVQIGRRNAEPIAPRKAFGKNGSLVCCVVITPLEPAASAVRRIAPTFTGLLIPCMTTIKGDAGWRAEKLASFLVGRPASSTIPWGVFV